MRLQREACGSEGAVLADALHWRGAVGADVRVEVVTDQVDDVGLACRSFDKNYEKLTVQGLDRNTCFTTFQQYEVSQASLSSGDQCTSGREKSWFTDLSVPFCINSFSALP